VIASEDGFRDAIRASELHRSGDDRASLIDLPGSFTWPITLTSFILVDAAPPTAAKAEPAFRFIYWCFMNGDKLTQGTGFAPLPPTTQAKVASRLSAVRPADGRVVNFTAF